MQEWIVALIGSLVLIGLIGADIERGWQQPETEPDVQMYLCWHARATGNYAQLRECV